MAKAKPLPADLNVFSGYSATELDLLKSYFDEETYDAGTVVFNENDSGDSMCIIIDGCVQISTKVAGDIQKTLITLRNGGMFGEMSLIADETFRSATATALEATTLITINKASYADLLKQKPPLGLKLTQYINSILTERLRNTTAMYRQAVEWGISISGILELNFHRLIAEQSNVSIELSNGKTVVGTLLKADKGESGHELLLKNANNELLIIPYHAVSCISFPNQTVKEG